MRLPTAEVSPRPAAGQATSADLAILSSLLRRDRDQTRRMGRVYLRLRRIYLGVRRDPRRFAYTDVAMSVSDDDEVGRLELFATEAAQAYVGEQRRLQDIRSG